MQLCRIVRPFFGLDLCLKVLTKQKRTDHNSSARSTIIPTTTMNLLSILAIAAVAVNSAGECLYLVPIHQILYWLIHCCPFSSSFFASAWSIHHIYIAESAFATTIAATDADDVAIMSLESEGNFNQAMAMGNMLRGAAGVVSLRNNNDSFNEVDVPAATKSVPVAVPIVGWPAQCKKKGDSCNSSAQCCEYK